MKIWLWCVSIMVLIALLVGQIYKLNFKDSGLLSLKNVSDAYEVNSRLNYIIGADKADEERIYKSLTKDEDEYISNSEKAPIVILGKPTGNFQQNSSSFGQEIMVEKVIKGSDIIENNTYFIFKHNGFDIRAEDRPVYTDTKNVMNADSTYLLFLEASELNDYGREKSYLLTGGYFDYLNISSSKSTPINLSLGDVQFKDMKENEFFSSSERILNQMEVIKQRLIEKWI